MYHGRAGKSSPAGEIPARRGQGRTFCHEIVTDGAPKGSLDGSRTMRERRAKMAAHTLRVDPVNNFRIVNRAEGARAGPPGPRGVPQEGCEKRRPRSGGRSPLGTSLAHPGAPSGGGGAGGRRGEPFGLHSSRTEAQRLGLGAAAAGAIKARQGGRARPAGRKTPQQGRRGGRAANARGRGQESRATARHSPRAGAARARSPKGAGRGGPAGPRAAQGPRPSAARATEQGARSAAKPGPQADGASAKGPGSRRREAPREGAGGHPAGPATARPKAAGRNAPDRSREAGAGAQAAAGPAQGKGPRRKWGPQAGRKRAQRAQRAYLLWRRSAAKEPSGTGGPRMGTRDPARCPMGDGASPRSGAKRRGAAAPRASATSGRAKRRPRAARAVHLPQPLYLIIGHYSVRASE